MTARLPRRPVPYDAAIATAALLPAVPTAVLAQDAAVPAGTLLGVALLAAGALRRRSTPS